MHDDERNGLERRIAQMAPQPADDSTLAAVSARALSAEDRPVKRRLLMRSSWALAVSIVAIAGVALAIAGRGPHLTIAFAEEDALAALMPEAGQVVHIKTRTFAKNEGDKEWIQDGSEYEESWIDFEHNTQRAQYRVTGTDKVLSDAVYADGRIRFAADDPGTPEPTVYASEMHAPWRVGGTTFWAYTYLPEVMDEGKVVGEVVQDGQRCWDVRWEDSKDAAGNKMSARALFRQPDYRPLLIERDYPKGAFERWEVLEWTVLDREDVPVGTFDPKTIGPGLPEGLAWYDDELTDHVAYPVYWAGMKMGKREILADLSEPTPGDVNARPFVINYLRFDQKVDGFFSGDRTSAIYLPTDGEQSPVTISSGAFASSGTLAESVKRVWGTLPNETSPSPLGDALVAAAGEGFVAAINAGEVIVIVEAPDRDSLGEALAALTLFR